MKASKKRPVGAKDGIGQLVTHVFRVKRFLPTGHPVIEHMGEWEEGMPLHVSDYLAVYKGESVTVDVDALGDEARAAIFRTAMGRDVPAGKQVCLTVRRIRESGYKAALRAVKGAAR